MDNFNIFAELHNSLYRKTFSGWEIPPRTISDHELMLVISGKGTVCINDKKITARKGMLFHFSPGIVHSLTTDLDDMMSFYAVHFDIFSFLKDRLPSIAPFQVDVVSVPSGYHTLKNLFKSINTYSKNKPYGYELACSSLLGQLIFETVRNTKNSEVNYGAQKKAEEVISYINDNIEKKLTLCDIADNFSLNSSYLSTLFKEATGYNVTEFINNLKIDKAKEFIIEGRYKIKEISSLLGYDDPYYFSRVFKSIEGISPSGYYKRYINTDF